jgi:hypothetical protein
MEIVKNILTITKKFIAAHIAEILVAACFVVILSTTTFISQLPFKSYGDVWAHLAFVEELKKPLEQVGDPYYNEGSRDPHNGIYPVAIAKVSQWTGVSHVYLMQLSGVISFVAVYFTTIFAYRTFFPDRKGKNIDSIVLGVIMFLGWESYRLSYAGYFSLADIAIGIMFPHLFALALFNLAIALYYKLLQKQRDKKSITQIVLLQLVVAILSAGILLTHVITGVILMYSFLIFTGYFFIFEYRFRAPWIFFLNALIPALAILLCLFWPFYNFLDPFTKLQTIHTDTPISSIFELQDWLAVAGIMLVGIFSVLIVKNRIITIWFFALLFVLASYLYPVRISSYWRFFPITLLALSFLVTYWLSSMNRTMRTFILFMILIFGFSSFINKVDTIGYRQPVTLESFQFLEQIPKDKMILSDSETSYLFSGLTGHAVLVVNKTHWNPVNHEVSEERYKDSLAFWRENDETGSTYVIDKYRVEYVLINKKIFRNYNEYAVMLGSKYRMKELFQDKSYLLLQIIY